MTRGARIVLKGSKNGKKVKAKVHHGPVEVDSRERNTRWE